VGEFKGYAGFGNMLNVDALGIHVAGFELTEGDVNPSRDIGAFEVRFSDLSIIEREKNEGYYGVVVLGDRCLGGTLLILKKTLAFIGVSWFSAEALGNS
jgi:hypothetical protein